MTRTIASTARDTAAGDPPRRAARARAAFFAGSISHGIELGRLERATQLSLQPVGHRLYLVTGGAERHFVDLTSSAPSPCDCDDRIRVAPCKHILRARLHEGDEVVLGALAVLVSAYNTYARDLERRLRPRPIRLTKALVSQVARTVGHPVAALSFERQLTDTDGTVTVRLGTTGFVLGRVVRDEKGITFLREAPAAETPRAAA